jgi:Flp pilus assembly pilin Flp
MAIFMKRLLDGESGVTAIEYGLIAALIVVGSYLALDSVEVSLNLSRTFSTVAASL